MAWPRNVTKADLRIETMRGSGKGGQKRNKTETAVRITHLPTGASEFSDDTRHQSQNKKVAFRRLVEQLVPLMKREHAKARYAGTTERIRTYHQPDQRVTDIRLPGRQWGYDEVLYGTKLEEITNELTRRPKSSTGRKE